MAEEANIKAHVSTYDSMIAWFKWGAIITAIVVAIVIWLIA